MSSAEGNLPSAAEAAAAVGSGAPPRGRLFRKCALLVIALVGATLLINSAFDFWFSYQENKAALVRVQQEKADAAATRIGEFVGEIERQIGWTTHAQWASGPIDQRRQDYFRLLRQVPAITELAQLDAEGREQLKVSRLSMDVVGSAADFSQSPAFIQAKAHRIWFSPVYFRKQSEPYMTLAVERDGRNAGVTIAEINLKLIWDVITALKIGEGGYAYVIDGRGRLIAHPDISLVLRDTDLSKLPQVAAALAPGPELRPEPGPRDKAQAVTVARNLGGHSVLTAHAAIAPLGWRVFVEVPLAEAFAPLYGAALRTLLLLAVGLVAATLVALVLARRMTGPIRAIAAGAERIGLGELDRRIEIHTGDELEALAEQFNRMGADLQKSYAELEQRVRDRTAELSESLDQQTATAEVLQVINSSPGDLAPVFDAMLEKAHTLCGAAHGSLTVYDGEFFRAVATHGMPDEFASVLRRPRPAGFVQQRLQAGERFVGIADMKTLTVSPSDIVTPFGIEAGIRSQLFVPLRKDGVLLGYITAHRREVQPFSEKEITLLENFAAQAVVAIENARLIAETQEALEQQTATAEVLQVINSSPGDLAPVFDAILEKAHTLCGAAYGALIVHDGEHFRAVATHGLHEQFEEMLRRPFPAYVGSPQQRMLQGERLIHIPDQAASGQTNPIGRASVELTGTRTILFVPLRKDDALLGYISAFRQEVRPFTDKEIALLQNFAAQAVIAMENARLITETREALEQQTATAEILQVINSSPGDLTPVFDAMLEKAMHLCGASFGTLQIDDGDRFRTAATHNVPAAFAKYREGHAFVEGPGTLGARIRAGERVVHVLDLKDDEPYRVGDPNRRALVDLGRARTGLAVPLTKEGNALGFIIIYREEVRPFSDKQIALLRNFAAQAVIAMENARLITETREALEQQTATAEILGVINASPGDLAPVFDAILEKAHTLCGAAHGALMAYDGEHCRAVAMQGMPEKFAELLRQPFRPPPGGPQDRLLRGERLIHIPDFTAREQTTPIARAAVEAGERTVLFVPLRKDDALLGYITAFRKEVRPFSDKQIALLQNFAAQAVIAMENARLITETREALEQQTATAEVLQVINSSPGDLAPVFQAIVEKAHALCGATYGSLQLWDGEKFRGVAMRGFPEAMVEALRLGYSPGPNMPCRRLVEGESVAHCSDLAEIDDPTAQQGGVALAGIRTILYVALRKDDVLLGQIVAARREVRPFSEKEIALVESFAAQAVIAMENARLITETREALEQQTATAEVLQVINSSPGDLGPVFDAMLEKATNLCEASFGILWNFSDGLARAGALHQVPAAFAELCRTPFRPSPASGPARMMRGEGTVAVADLTTEAGYLAGDVMVRAIVDLGGARSIVVTPLRKDGAALGAITLYRQEVRPFTDKQVALLQNFAAQAVIAMENARLFGELRSRTDELARSVEELKALGEVGQAVSSTLDLRAVLATILNRSVAMAGAEAGVIFRYARAERAFRFVEAVGYSEAMVREVRDLGVGETATGMGEAVANRAPLQIPDLRLRPPNPLRDAAVAAGFRSVLIVPLVGADRVMGATILQRRAVGEFPEATVRLMQALASQSVLAIQNARLFREIAEKSEQLAQASEHKSQFLANMSHELRTPLNAILGYTELMADGIYGELPPRAAGVLERVQNNGRHLLALINDVLDLAKIEAGQLTLTLEDYALPDVVQSVVSATEGLANTKGIVLSADVMPGLPMGHGDARRLAQVLLNLVGNAVKFTDAGEVAIAAAAENGNFVLTVRDTGPGIAPGDHDKIFGEFQQIDNSNTRKKGGTGLGLAISKRMVEMQGGTISVDSELGQGATFRVTLPVRVEDMTGELTGELMGAA
jgi:GAF domain-containing protein